MLTRTSGLILASLLAVASCGKSDNSAQTDKASKDLRQAQSAVSAKSTDVAKNAQDIEQQKRDLVQEQQALADKQKLLEQQQAALGSAKVTLQAARAAYGAAVKARYAKLDSAIAELATKTDAKSVDAATGLRARRDLLATKLTLMDGTADLAWDTYTKDVDTTFDAIEHDLQSAAH